eukprot:131242-Pleurochrysis_carterae.AAC.2
MPAAFAIDASARDDVGRMVAQNSRFQGPAALTVAHRNEAHERSSLWNLRTIDHGLTSVASVISDLDPLRLSPTDAILYHRLFAG